MEQAMRLVRTKDTLPFHCRECGNCCRHVEDSVMLEAYDAYRLGHYLQPLGKIDTIEDVYAKYAHPSLLSDGFPAFALNTCGDDQHCVFLQNGRCRIYEGRPRVCRIYPFTVTNGQRGKRFLFYQCMDRHASHFSGGHISVKDWMYENFPRVERDLLEKEAATLPKIGRLMRSLTPEQKEHFLFQMLYYRCYNFDLEQPFQPQYDHNQHSLFHALQEFAAKKE